MPTKRRAARGRGHRITPAARDAFDRLEANVLVFCEQVVGEQCALSE
jgi:hypothetical protein